VVVEEARRALRYPSSARECRVRFHPGLLEMNTPQRRGEKWGDHGMFTPAARATRSRSCTRELLESVIRRRVAALSGVSFLEHLEVIGLIAGGASQIKGVEVRRRADAAVEADQADLSAEVHPPQVGQRRYRPCPLSADHPG